MNISQTLGKELPRRINNSDAIYVAVALMTSKGLSTILNNVSEKCHQEYLIGLDLPSDPAALRTLYELSIRIGIRVRVHTDEQEYFHPKVYLFKKGDAFSSYVGSANCTGRGLGSNIELSVLVNDTGSCTEIYEWFQ